MARSLPERGEVWLVDLGYLAKRRPCVILNVELIDADRTLVACVPRTTKVQQTRFEVEIKARYLDEPGAFDAQGVVAAHLVKCERKLGTLTPEQLALIEDSVKRWLGFTTNP